MVRCRTCDHVAQRDAGKAPLWDKIRRTRYWDVAHSFNTSLRCAHIRSIQPAPQDCVDEAQMNTISRGVRQALLTI